jgi:uncharacterized oligopeptide transporter (OPT) family protein
MSSDAGRADAPIPSSGGRELTPRALATGMLLGALLAPCNVYSGLKIGWSFNMSITALLLAYAFWVPLGRALGLPRWSLLESNINQTAASSAASIISGGLVAPIPALALMSGGNLPWPTLVVWVFSVSFLGVWVGWILRDRLIVQSTLAFPAGAATAETLRDIFSHGRAAAQRVTVLLSSLGGAALFNAIDDFVWRIPRWAPTAGAQRLTFSFDPSLLLLGFGSIIGVRAGLGLLVGAVVAWGVLGPWLVASGTVAVAEGEGWFQPLVGWLLWPGVAMMVTASLTSFVSMVRSSGWDEGPRRGPIWERRNRPRLLGLAAASVLVVWLQIAIFDIHWTMALVAVPFSFVLATVAARVTGETGIPPIGAIGKVSQLGFGVLAPGQAVTNLMTANVAGGAAGQGADLLNDLKAGHEVGAHVGRQVVAQCFGVLTGSLVGSWVYLQIIADPMAQLLTPEWPAPAVATWKAVAETLSVGLSGIPESAVVAMCVTAPLGVLLALLERRLRGRALTWLPSGATLGLAFVVPASTSITLFLGALGGAALRKAAPGWSARFLMSAAAGLVAGESLFGVVAVWL